jgi:pyrroline-5-carboxylate reductase
VIAIPAKAFRDMTEKNEQARQFTGNIFNAAASLSRETVHRAFPQATVVRIAPFLIHDVNSIPMLVLRPTDLAASEWVKVKSELANLGDVDVVEDEATFTHLALLGAPWPAVVLAALQAAASVGVQDLKDERAIGVGRRIFLRAMQSILADYAGGPEPESSDEIVTPGGITECGLESLGDITTLFKSVLSRMQARADELRA